MTRVTGLVMLMASASSLSFTGLSIGGHNPFFTFPLHAKVSQQEPCGGYLPVDCLSNRPLVNVPEGSEVVIYLFLMNFSDAWAIETAFEWDPGWVLVDSFWNCQRGQIYAVRPQEPGGPQAGTIATAFDCVLGPALAPIGGMSFLTGSSGCLSQVQSSYPDGVAVMDCTWGLDYINPDDPQDRLRLGKVCVGTGGHDACDLLTTPAAPTTWGTIKATYR